MSDALIVGIDMIRFGRFPDRKVEELGAEAALLALKDAGLTIADCQAVYCGNQLDAGGRVGQRIMRQIGQTGVAVSNVSNACATGATAFREAWLAVLSGEYDIVLAIGCEQMGKGLLGAPENVHGVTLEGHLGSATMPAAFAELGTEHARKYGTTFEQFAKVSVKNHHHSTLNDKAMYRFETPIDQVMGAEMIAWPLTKFMCSVNVDGAAAAVLMSERKAKELGLMARAIRVRASALASDPYTPQNMAMMDFNAVTRLAADQAYARAGVGPGDVDLVELHDCFATAELVHYENLRLCGEGEAGRLIDSGDTAIGGRQPVNLSGGLLSKGHPLGATGIANLYEISLHLRGEAGARQVEGARLGLTHVVGAGSACAVHILEHA
jgi:acetyl-CoA acetyltransferase